jgi:YtkA-like
MARRLVVAMTMAIAGAALAAGPAAAGGWATVGLDSVPGGIRAGEAWTVRLTILQHGRTPLEGVQPELTISKADGAADRTFAATPTRQPGVYRASVVFPSAGSWDYVVDDGFSARHSFGPVRVADATGAAGGAVPVAVATPDQDGGPWGAVAAALAAGLIAAGVVLVVQRQSHGGPPPTEG